MNVGSSEISFGHRANSHKRPKSRDDFRIAIVCALEIESTAVAAMFDELWEPPLYGRLANDSNEYTAARIGEHNAILAYLPGMGGSASAAAIANLLASYQRIELALLVGVCGAVPIDEKVGQIFLGDVVISDSIVQYDYARRYPDKLRRKDDTAESLSRPNPRIRSFLHKTRTLQSRAQIQQQTHLFLEQMINDKTFSSWNRPLAETDNIYESSYRHKHQVPGFCAVCDKCKQDSDEVCETALTATCDELGCNTVKSSVHDRTGTVFFPRIHFGTVASANQVMKSANDRDTIAKDEKVIAFEMEGAGLWNYVPTIIIKGVCDYADSHKNKSWQKYAAASSASCMKAFIEQWTPTDQHCPKELRGYIALPHRRVTNFLGRCDTLGRIDRVLCSSRRGPRIATLCGIGGQGKTQVALEYCERKKNNPFHSIFWIDAKSSSALITSLENIAEMLRSINEHLPSSDAKVSSVMRKLAAWDAPWLLVFDNYDDVNAFDIQDYFPRGEAGAILVTSRHADTSELVYDSRTDHIELGGLDDVSAKSLLLGRPLDTEQVDTAIEVGNAVHRLGNHPLAIAQAAAYMKQQRITPAKFLDHYDRRRKNILKTAPKLSRYKRKLDEEANESALNVFATFELSFQQLEAQVGINGPPARLVALLSLFDHQRVPEELFMGYPQSKFAGLPLHGFDVLEHFFDEESWNHERFTEVLNSISVLSLIHLSVDQENNLCRIGLHPLVKDWIRLRTDSKILSEMSHVVTILLARRICDFWQDDQFRKALDLKQELLLHVLAQESNCDEFGTAARLPFNLKLTEYYLSYQYWEGLFAYEMGYYGAAEKAVRRTWESRKLILGEDHSDTLTALSLLAGIHNRQGRWKEAKAFQVHLVNVRKRTLGHKNAETLRSIAELVYTLKELGKWKEAKELGLYALETCKDHLGEEHPTTLVCMAYLTQTYGHADEWTKAEELGKRTLEIRKRIKGEEHPETLAISNALTRIYLAQGKYEHAETLGLYVVGTEKRILGPDHSHTLISMRDLAKVYHKQAKFDNAQKLYLEVLKAQMRVLGKEHPHTLTSMYDLGALLQDRGELDESARYLIQAVEGSRNVLGEEDPNTLARMGWLAQTYQKQNQWQHAETLMLQILEKRKQVDGLEHSRTQRDMINLAILYVRQHRLQNAEDIYLQLLEARKRVLGDENPDTLTTKVNLAAVYWKQGKVDEAENMELKVLDARKRVLGEDHRNTLTTESNLAAIYWKQGKLDEAEKLERKVLDGRMRNLGEDHHDTLTTKAELVHMYWQQGRLDEAAKLKLEILETMIRVLGDDHPKTTGAMKSLATIYRGQGRDEEAEKLDQRAAELEHRGLSEDRTERNERSEQRKAIPKNGALGHTT